MLTAMSGFFGTIYGFAVTLGCSAGVVIGAKWYER